MRRAIYSDKIISEGRDLLSRYCNEGSLFIRFLLEPEKYLKNARKALQRYSCRFPETKSEYINLIKKVMKMFLVELKYREPIEEGDSLVRAVSGNELSEYLEQSETVIKSPMSYCLNKNDALTFAKDTKKPAIIIFEYSGKQLYVNKLINPRFDNERESIITGGVIKNIEYVGIEDGIEIYRAKLEERCFLSQATNLDDIVQHSMILNEYEVEHDFLPFLQQDEEWKGILEDENDDLGLKLTYPQAINAYINGEIGEELFEDKSFRDWLRKMGRICRNAFFICTK